MNDTTSMLTVTRRSQIGFAWTNSPECWYDRFGQGHLRISGPSDVPDVKGFPRRVADEYNRVARNNNSND